MPGQQEGIVATVCLLARRYTSTLFEPLRGLRPGALMDRGKWNTTGC